MKSSLPRRVDFVNFDRVHRKCFYDSRRKAFCLYRSLKSSSVLIEVLLDRPVKEVNLIKELFAQKLLRITSYVANPLSQDVCV